MEDEIIKKSTFDELKKEVNDSLLNSKPNDWRDGQFVFNYINAMYGVARYVQFQRNVDCFYNDSQIDEFIKECAIAITQIEDDDNNNNR